MRIYLPGLADDVEVGVPSALREAYIDDQLAATPAQRLEMLEAMIELAAGIEASRARQLAGPDPTPVRPDSDPPADSSTAG